MTRLDRTNAKVGDGATIQLWSDSHACTIIKVTAETITLQQDKATLDPIFKPEFTPGGHCTNQDKQTYTYERDPEGKVTTFHWSNKYKRYSKPGYETILEGRSEFYDYNF